MAKTKNQPCLAHFVFAPCGGKNSTLFIIYYFLSIIYCSLYTASISLSTSVKCSSIEQ